MLAMSENQLLQLAVESGIINLTTIQQLVEMNERKKYFEMHEHEIWRGTKGGYFTYLPDATQPKGRKLVRRTKKKDLEELIIEYYREKAEEPTIGALFDMWLNEKMAFKEIGKGTYDRYENDYKRFIKGTEFDKIKITSVNEEILEIFIRQTIAEKELTVKAYSKLRTIILGIFKFAKRKKYTDFSISLFFKDLDLSSRIFLKNYKPKETQVFNEDEIPKLLKWLREHPSVENYGIILVFQTGIREGELSALKYSDVDFDKRILTVQRQEIKYKDRVNNSLVHEIVNYTKTDAGMREIYLTDNAIATIKAIRRLNPFNEYLMQVGNKKIWSCIFNDRLYKACDKCGIPRRSMHKIRKTYGTTLIDSGADESLIMSQMGHSEIATTHKYYYFANKNHSTNRKQIEKAICW